MNNKRFDSVWDAIEDTPEVAENMKLRSALMMILTEYLNSAGLDQKQAASRLHVTQPRISDLMRGKIDRFGLDTLINMASAAGLTVEMRVFSPDQNRAEPLGTVRALAQQPAV